MAFAVVIVLLVIGTVVFHFSQAFGGPLVFYRDCDKLGSYRFHDKCDLLGDRRRLHNPESFHGMVRLQISPSARTQGRIRA